MKKLITVIIPCYNAQDFIERTINSVLNQTYDKLELIIVDDGSIDNCKNIISKINSDKLTYFYQKNAGVSAARNKGLSLAKGDYILFLDADDLIVDNFIENRFSFLTENDRFNACCSIIHTIDINDNLISNSYSNISNIEELLTFEDKKFSCPSGYLFKTSSLTENNLSFNINLSSSADRYFLLEYFNFNKIGFVNDSPLLYRIISSSMSNNLTNSLIVDQIKYLELLSLSHYIPNKIKNQILSRTCYTLSASFYHLNVKKKALLYLVKAFYLSPKITLKLLFNI